MTRSIIILIYVKLPETTGAINDGISRLILSTSTVEVCLSLADNIMSVSVSLQQSHEAAEETGLHCLSWSSRRFVHWPTIFGGRIIVLSRSVSLMLEDPP